MRFGRDRAVAHRPRAESLDDVSYGIHFRQWNRFALAELQQSSQVTGARCFGIHKFRKVLVCGLVAGPGRLLYTANRVRIPRMLFTLTTPCEQTGIRQFVRNAVGIFREADVMPHQRFLSQHVEIHALDTAGRSRKTQVYDVIGQSKRFKDLSPFVALKRGDPHLGHHL